MRPRGTKTDAKRIQKTYPREEKRCQQQKKDMTKYISKKDRENERKLTEASKKTNQK